MRVLMLLTAGPAGRPWLSLSIDQVVGPYYGLQDAGAEVVVSSILGGDPAIRGARRPRARANAALERFRSDRRARDAISDTLMFTQVFAEDFDAGIWVGAVETPAASGEAAAAASLVAALLSAGKPAAVVPHELLAAEALPEGPLILSNSSSRAVKALLAALHAAAECPPQQTLTEGEPP